MEFKYLATVSLKEAAKRMGSWNIFRMELYEVYNIYIYVYQSSIYESYIYIYENQKLRALWYIKIRNRWDWYMKTMN